ncbi:hypothetical protein GGU11DRAFT_753955 [Lentinula aff. detonsa]|uniref:Uncharacterized protein n=1 Tax=Lentinula aff. detonsa TaxID=2804958 RepID=A0AA38NTT9_9AGAR|nr:hypothetical protein GGU10DRAFT_64229 [Lentinula aff. detonsa]KAJ3801039.1 hypothetical protein GGU11DRAFT_753955 [Lentinula aff. detonsa]
MLKHSSKEPLLSSSKSNGRKLTFSRQQLLQHLALLNTMPSPLPPTLPPSPPASRSASPVPGPSVQSAKRKSEITLDIDRSKRSRTESIVSTHRVSQPSPIHHLPRSELAEDGEVAEEPSLVSHPAQSRATTIHIPSDPSANSFVPIRRPKRGHQHTIQLIPTLHEKYHQAGRKLKYSGDARFWSTYPPSHKEYRPIPNAPPPNSLYHIHGGMVAKLELMEALVMFVYSSWCKEYGRGAIYPDSWLSMEGFIKWCKAKWKPEEGSSDAEKAFHGLIHMFHAFIHARIVTHSHRKLRSDLERITEATYQAVNAAITDAASHGSSSLGVKSQSTPPMLPSPASIGATNSANSTPTNRDGTPISSEIRSASTSSSSAINVPPPSSSSSPSGPSIPLPLLPPEYRTGIPPPHVTAAANSVSAPFNLNQLATVNEVSFSLSVAISEMQTAQTHLNFSIMARHFPRTFARMVHSTLKSTEEHEVDFEDDDGELFWPGQSITGDGLGWLCYMGEAMVQEFGKQFDYKGLKGVVPKPDQYDPRLRLSSSGIAGQR